MGYQDVRQQWINDPDAFWEAASREIDWYSPPDAVRDDTTRTDGWFPGAELNTCYNALDRHADGPAGGQAALIYDSVMTDTRRTFTYRELREKVAELAGALQRAGVVKGDRVLVYMPMIPEAAMAMLACARIGAIHSVVFGGFAAQEVATRITQAKPTLILSASCGLEPGRVIDYHAILHDAMSQSEHQVSQLVVLQRSAKLATLNSQTDIDWKTFVAGAKPADCVAVAADDPLYILYTSGTTGQPKGVVRDNGGHAVALHWSMHAIYGIRQGDVFWAASDIGWVVGHSYIVYGPLLAGATTILFEGKPVGTPDASTFWRVISEYQVNVLFTAPTAIRAIKREDPELALTHAFDLSCLKALFLAGERCDPDTLTWASNALKIPVIDHWWQTETGWCVAGNMFGAGLFDVRIGSAGKAMPGWDVQVLDDEGQPQTTGEIGAIACKLPLGPGALTTLWENATYFEDTYFSSYPGYYQTGDAGYIDADGYIFVMTRTDDIINVAGHRLSTGALEEVLAAHPDIAECAVTGVADALKGQVPMAFVCLKAGVNNAEPRIVDECVALVRQKIGAVASLRQVLVVQRLPKTRSGKILRATLTKMVDGVAYSVPPTIDDPAILSEIEARLHFYQGNKA